MLWEEMAKYTELTGEDATHVPLIKLGAYLDGYEKGIEVLDEIRSEIKQAYCDITNDYDRGRNYGLHMAVQIIDKYRKE